MDLILYLWQSYFRSEPAALYLEGRRESGHIWKPYKQKLDIYKGSLRREG